MANALCSRYLSVQCAVCSVQGRLSPYGRYALLLSIVGIYLPRFSDPNMSREKKNLKY